MRPIVVAAGVLLAFGVCGAGARAQHAAPPTTAVAAWGTDSVWPHGAMEINFLPTRIIVSRLRIVRIVTKAERPPLAFGMVDDVAYQNHALTLIAGDVLTFVSDGIVEAMHVESKELFGFERARAMSMRSALEQIDAARAFGQNDDITVLRVSKLAQVAA